jgi:hypothetical protein
MLYSMVRGPEEDLRDKGLSLLGAGHFPSGATQADGRHPHPRHPILPTLTYTTGPRTGRKLELLLMRPSPQ